VGDGSKQFISKGEGKRRYCNRVVEVRIGVHIHHQSGKTGKRWEQQVRVNNEQHAIKKKTTHLG